MRTFILKAAGVMLGVWFAFSGWGQNCQNCCVEGGPHTNIVSCQAGQVTSSGALSFTTTNVCAGSSVIAPTLTTGVSIGTGTQVKHIFWDCPTSPSPFNQSVTVTYSIGSLYFTPTNFSWPSSITGPFNTPGTYVYRAQVNCTPNPGGGCSTVIVTVAQVIITVTSSPPVFVTQPQSQSVWVNDDATFTSAGTGCPSVSYQWYFNSGAIANATNPSLTVFSAQTANAGNYTVVLTDASGSVTSSVAVLTVTVPSCTPTPSGLIGWWKGENNANDSAGINNGVGQNISYTNGIVGKAFAFDPAGPYTGVKIPDNSAYVLTNAFSIEAWVRPRGNGSVVFWRGDNRPGLDPYSLSMQGNNHVRFNITDNGGNSPYVDVPLSFNRWWHLVATFDASAGVMKLYTNGVLAGQTNTALIPIGNLIAGDSPGVGIGNVNDGANNFPFLGDIDEASLYSRALTATEAAALYNAGSAGKCPGSAPVITVQPSINQTVNQGSNVTFEVVATGTAPLSYQWQFGAANIASETNSIYVNYNVQAGDTGNYRVIVSNPFGSVTSSNAHLTVLSPPAITSQPTNVSVTYGASASFSVTATGASSYQWFHNGIAIPGATASNYSITRPTVLSSGGVYTVTVYGANSGHVASAPATLTVRRAVLTITADNASRAYGQPNPAFTWHYSGFVAGEDQSVLTGDPVLYTLATQGSPVAGSPYTIFASQGNSDDPSLTADNYSFHFVSGQLTVTKASLSVTANNQMRVTGTANPAFSGVVNPAFVPSDNITVSYSTPATVSSSAGTYSIIPALSDPNDKLQNYNVTIVNGTLTVSDAPLITVQPVSIVRAPLATATATFTVAAIGTPTIVYHWSKNNQLLSDNGHVSGSATATLTLTGITATDAGSYSVSVQNGAGATNSASATLSVSDVAVVTNPPPQFGVPGGSVFFTVGAQSVCNPPGFQWKKDGVSIVNGVYWPNPAIASNIVGATSATVGLTNIRATAAGVYTVALNCNQTTTNSPGGTLSVCDLYPIVTSTNTILAHKPGDSISVSFQNSPNGDNDFGWATWTGSTSDGGNNGLLQSFQTPNSFNYVNPVSGGTPPIDVGKYVCKNNGTKNNTLQYIHDNLLNQELSIIVWDTSSASINNPNGAYHIYSFARIAITSVTVNGQNSSLTFVYRGVGRCIDQCMPPIITLPSGSVTFTEKQSPQIVDSAATVVDFDSPNFSGGVLTIDFSAGGLPEDSISIRNQGAGTGQIGLTTISGATYVTYGGVTIGNVVTYLGNNPLQIAFNSSATREAVTALLQNITYQDTSCNPSVADRTLRFVMSDGGGCTSTAVFKTIHVVAVNDQPTLGDMANISVLSCSAPITVQLSGITAGCSENQTLTVTATSSVTGLVPNPTVTYTSPNTTGILTVSPTGTGIGTTTISVTVQDNGGTANGGVNSITKNFTVTVLNCVPIIAFNSTLTYTENNPPSVIDAIFSLSDPDSPNLNGGSLTYDFIANGQGEDRLGIQAAGGISLNGQNVSYQGIQIGTFSGGTVAQPLVIAFNANATPAAALALSRNITYYNVSDTPSPLTRTVRAVMNDGAGGVSAPTTTSIFVIPVNDAPVANPDSYTVAQGATLTILAPGVLGNDTDIEGDTLTASLVTAPTHGALTLNPNGSFTYTPNVGNTATSDTFVYRATDSGMTGGQPDPKSSTATVTITITPPTCVAPGFSLSLNQNTVQGGNSVSGVITLAAATTLLGGQVVNLTSDTGSAVPPISVLIPQGGQTASFSVQTLVVAADTTATITATYPGKPPMTAGLTITAAPPQSGVPTDQPPGFKYSLFADGLVVDRVGPVGMVKNAFGQVLVTLPWINEVVVLSDVDGQHYDPTVTPPVNTDTSIYGLTKLGNKIYGAADGTFSGLAQLSDSGAIIQEFNISGLPGLVAVCANPQNGLLYASDDQSGQIYEIDPDSQTFRIAVADGGAAFDGIAVSPDGGTVYGADYGNNFVRGYDIVTGARVLNVQVSPPNGGTVDGIAIGQGDLSGKIFVNCTSGELMEIDIPTGVATTFSKEQGSRGDFVMVDDDGSMLITQTSEILRLTPPAGSTFGAIKGTIVVRNDDGITYPVINLNSATPILEAVSSQTAGFDVRGISGNVASAYMSRSGTSSYTANNAFQVEYGVAPFDPNNDNPNKVKSYPPQVSLAAASPGIANYSPSWTLPSPYLQNIQVSLGGDYQVLLADRISSVCGAVTLADTPQAQWPQGRNTLTFLATATANPQIPAGSSLDMALFGNNVPLNGDWDILLGGVIVASSGSPKGWNVELDQTPYAGAIVSVPITATIANGYEVRVAEGLAKSGTFDVVPAASIVRAPTLLPIVLSVNPVSAGGTVNITIGLDQAAPSGVTVYLSSDNASVSVPASVQIATGTSTKTVTVSVPSGASAGTAHISAIFNGTRRASLRIITGTGTPPAPPTPVATPAPNQVTLTWSATSGLTYNIKRSRNSGGPYTTIFAGLSGSSYVDTGVVNGLTYYYVVSAQNDFGEGANSVQVSATPVLGQVADPAVVFNSPQVTLSDATTGAIIHYTLDGSQPTEGSPVFKSPFSITTTTTINAKAYKTGYLPSNIASQTETITISPSGTSINCGNYLTSENLSSSSDRSWLRGQSFNANHYSLGNFAPNSKIIITMASSQINSFLYLFDDSGNMLASNDDDGAGGVNAKIVYTVPSSPTANGYFVEATTSAGGQSGTYTLFLDCGTTPPQIVVDDSGNNAIGNGAIISVGTSGNVFPNTLATFGLVIKNGASASTGSGLNLGRLQMIGDFAIDTQLVPEIPPQQSSGPITVGLLSSTLGAKQGTLTIPNDDPTGNPFVIHFSSTVVDPNLFPSVSITSPANNETIPDGTFADPNSILIQASATATEFPIAAVEFFATPSGQSAMKIGQATVPPYSMTWVGAAPTSGSRNYTLTAKVTDTAGRQTASSPVPITVNAPTLGGVPSISPAPGQYQGRITVTINPNSLPSGSTIIYTTDTSSSAQWYVYQQPIVFSYSDFSGAPFTLLAKGVKNGIFSAVASAGYTITSPGQSFPPEAQILSPADGDQITSLTNIMGVAALNPSDPGAFGSWRLEYHAHDDPNNPWVTFASGNSPVSSGSAFDPNHPFDPTLLINGLYDIRLSVFNAAGDVSTAQITVDVEGYQKVGNFTLSFVDLTVPVGGIPIQVTRTYDSRDKGQGDFGIGWRLSVSEAKVQETSKIGEGWDEEPYQQGFFPGFIIQPIATHRITIVLPGDASYSFEAAFDPMTSIFDPILTGRVIFNALPGTHATLQAVDADDDLDVEPATGGGYELFSGNNIYDPQEFDLSTPDGRTFRVRMGGGLESITDLRGDIITFTSDGIYKNNVSSGGSDTKFVSYTREPGGKNRITAITDDNNKSLSYTYGSGNQNPLDLVQVSDRMNQPTTFTYDTRHNLIDMVAPDGSHGVRNTYDDNGRLIKVTDANGNSTSYSYGDHSQTITDPLNHTMTLAYDDNGNVTTKSAVLDPSGANITVTLGAEYNDPNNPTKPTKKTDAMGRDSQFSYRSDGFILSLTDPLQRTTSFAYDDNGHLTDETDATGRNVVHNEYDSHGNLTHTVGADGSETTYAYNQDGTLANTRNQGGILTQFGYQGTVDIFDPSSGSLVTVPADPGNTGNPTSITDGNNHLSQFVYDGNGKQTHIVTTRTRNDGVVERIETVNQYDDNGRPTKSTLYAEVPGQALQSQVQQQKFYTPVGRLDHVIDVNGQQTSYAYDADGRTIGLTTPDGNTRTNVYDANGQLLSTTLYTTDGRRITVRHVYDSLGREIAIINPDGTQTTMAYDLNGQVIATTNANGNVRFSEYDEAGQLARSIDANGNAISFEYNQLGQRVSVTDANQSKTLYDYDLAGRCVKITYPDNTFTTTGYDLRGQILSQTDQAGISTAFAYDPVGNLTYVTNAVGTADQTIFQAVCDELGRVVKEYDQAQAVKLPADRKATLYDYDFLGHRIKKTLPGGQSEANAYAIVNNLLQVTHTDFNGTVTRQQYDAMGRMTQSALVSTTTVPPAGQASTVVTFDPATGARATMTDASGTTTYAYDLMGRLKQKTHSVLGSLSYTYDNVGNVLTIKSSHANGVSLTYHWDKQNRLIQADDANGNSTKYDYDKLGNLTDFTYPTTTPVTTSYAYNSLSRLTSMTVTRGVSGGVTLANFDYNSVVPLSPSGKWMAVSETINAGTTISRVVHYSYDSQYRFTKEDISGNGITGTIDYGPQVGVPNTGYDLDGNRRSRLVSLSQLIPGFGSVNSSYDDNNRLTSASYDANGNTLADAALVGAGVVIPTSANPDQYDLQNCLIRRTDGTKTIQIVYDGDGNRMWKTVTPGSPATTYYLVDDVNPSGHSQVVEELTMNAGSLQVAKVYNYGLHLISQVTPGGSPSVSYYGYDGHGNVRFLTDGAGNITDTYTYDVFGVLLSQTGSTPNNHLYCGEQFDPDLGTYYLRARYMNPNSGRFWTPDSFEGSQTEPMSLHKYLYANDDPVMGSDPSGLETILPSNPAIGKEVELAVWADFQAQMVIRYSTKEILKKLFYNTSIHGINDYSLGYGPTDDWRLRPDFVNTDSGEVYDCKPIERFEEGEEQVAGYCELLSKAEPRTTNPWMPGTNLGYTPAIEVVPLPDEGPNVEAIISPIIMNGVITYTVVKYDPPDDPIPIRVRVRETAKERVKTLAQQSTWIATVSTAVWTFLNNVGTAFLHILPYLVLGAALIGLAYVIAVALAELMIIVELA